MRGGRADRDITRDEQEPDSSDRLARADAAIPVEVEVRCRLTIDVKRKRQGREHRGAE